jgi:hypothetical protein
LILGFCNILRKLIITPSNQKEEGLLIQFFVNEAARERYLLISSVHHVSQNLDFDVISLSWKVFSSYFAFASKTSPSS